MQVLTTPSYVRINKFNADDFILELVWVKYHL